MNEARRVILAPYDPSWPSMYDEARREITEAVGDDILGIEHVGSTAVPGLTAKATIDIQGKRRVSLAMFISSSSMVATDLQPFVSETE